MTLLETLQQRLDVRNRLRHSVAELFRSAFAGEEFRTGLALESEALHVAGRHEVDTPDLLQIADRENESVLSYLRVHGQRLEQTFKILRALELPVGPNLLIDFGSWSPYLPVVQRIFPMLDVLCIGEPGLVTTKLGHDGVRWVGLDLESERIPVDDGSASVVLLLEVIEHFYQDPMFALAEANRVLAPGGKLVISTPNIASWRALTALLLHYSPYTYGKYTPGAPPHVHEYVPREIAILLKAAGFEERVWTSNVYNSGVSEKLLFILERFGFSVHDRGDTIFAVGTKTLSPITRFPPELYDGEPKGLLRRSFALRNERGTLPE